jgi:hypothetical protein
LKLRSLATVLVAVFALIALTGIPAASAQSGYTLCSSNGYCVYEFVAHNYFAEVLDTGSTSTSAGDEPIAFINRYVTSNGNAWWELNAVGTDQCLNWVLTDQSMVYWDDCVPGDPNELFYNHVAGQLISLAGNEDSGLETYLQPQSPCDTLCVLVVTATPYTGWTETPD